jgi:hypothetical protein
MDVAEEPRARPPARRQHLTACIQQIVKRLAVERQLAPTIQQPCKSLGGRGLSEDGPVARSADLTRCEGAHAREQGLQLLRGQVQRGVARSRLHVRPGRVNGQRAVPGAKGLGHRGPLPLLAAASASASVSKGRSRLSFPAGISNM